jgi:hypothetical protein
MGSTGKVALSVIMGLGALTGILSYYIFFDIAAPEPGVMPRASREPSPEGAATTPATSPPTGDVGKSKGNESHPQLLLLPQQLRLSLYLKVHQYKEILPMNQIRLQLR